MLAAGFVFQKGRIRLSVLERPVDQVQFRECRIIKVDPDLPMPELMERYASHFRSAIDEFQPEIIAARKVFNSLNLATAECQIAPFGILAYVSGEKGLIFKNYIPAALRSPGPFGLPKGTKPVEAVEVEFGAHPPNWDDLQKASVLVAWRALRECA